MVVAVLSVPRGPVPAPLPGRTSPPPQRAGEGGVSQVTGGPGCCVREAEGAIAAV